MKAVVRSPLPEDLAQYFAEQTLAISAQPEGQRRPVAQARWKGFNPPRKAQLRAILRGMAPGLDRCMYCEDNMGTDIEHFEPRQRAPSRTFDWSNHLWACSHCNSNAKRNQFPIGSTGSPLLIDPSVDDPRRHLQLSPMTGTVVSIGPKGQPSIDVFQLNRYVCERGRANAWAAVRELVVRYRAVRESGDTERADRIGRLLLEYPFQSVRSLILDIAGLGNAERILGDDVVDAIRACPELGDDSPPERNT